MAKQTGQPPKAADDTPPPEKTHWLYSGPPGRIYTNVPVTPEPGDVIAWVGAPAADGCWSETDARVNRMPDNWQPDIELPEPPSADVPAVPAVTEEASN